MSLSEPLQSSNGKVILELKNLSKRFGGVNALTDIDFDLYEGEVHGVVGENGAGKSTLMKILSGVYSDYEGQMLLNGNLVRFHSPSDANLQGIGMIHQELSIFPDLTVAENIFSRNLPVSKIGKVDWKLMKQQAAEHLQELGLNIDANTLMGILPVGVQQMVEIARIIFSGAKIIIMDEPTSALSLNETRRLFEFIKKLKAQGKTVIFISHFLEDVLNISDRVSVFRNSYHVATLDTKDLSKQKIIELMLGAENRLLLQSYQDNSTNLRHNQAKKGEVVLSVRNLSRTGSFSEVSFDIHAGEVLGLYSFVGAGQLQLARCLFGADRVNKGTITLKGKPIRLRSTTQAKRLGIAYVPDNRRDSLILTQEIYKNISLAHLNKLLPIILRRKPELELAIEKIQATRVRPPKPQLLVGALSGGNQQKVVLAKWLVQTPQVLILAEPTRGMDVGAKEEVLELIHELRTHGVAIFLVSSELETILANCDRVVVMHKGHISIELEGEQFNKDNLLLHA